MKKIFYLLLFCTQWAFCQSLTIGNEEDFEILKNLNHEHARAFATGDNEILDKKILADDFVLVATDGKIYNKKEVVADVINSKSSIKNIASHELENVVIRFVADDVAMVHARIKFKRTDGSIINQVQYNDIYAKKNGTWKCVSGNNSSVN